MKPQAADDPMTLWSAAGGDAAAAMKEGLSLVNAGEAGCGSARAGGRVLQLPSPLHPQLPCRAEEGRGSQLVVGDAGRD